MLFCNLETSYSLAHLIKHLKQNCMVPDFYGVYEQWAVEGAVWSVCGPGCRIASLPAPGWLAGSGLWAAQDAPEGWCLLGPSCCST